MEPEWQKLVKTCGNKYNLARVRDDQKDQLINNLGQNVQGFPTLGSTNNTGANNSGATNNSGNFNTYSGPRTADDFMQYIKQNLAQEKVKRAIKQTMRQKGWRCTRRINCQCARCKARRSGKAGKAGKATKGKKGRDNSRKRLVFVKPKGCGGRESKRLKAFRL